MEQKQKVIDLNDQKKTVGQRHIYTQELIKRLEKVAEGETITYEEMTNLIGLETRPQGRGYGYQKAARDILEKEADIVFECVETIGLRRMTKEEVAKSTADKYLREKKSSIRRNKRRINTVNNEFESLSKEAQTQTTFARTILAFDSEVMKRKNTKKIQNEISKTGTMIGFDSTVSLFK